MFAGDRALVRGWTGRTVRAGIVSEGGHRRSDSTLVTKMGQGRVRWCRVQVELVTERREEEMYYVIYVCSYVQKVG